MSTPENKVVILLRKAESALYEANRCLSIKNSDHRKAISQMANTLQDIGDFLDTTEPLKTDKDIIFRDIARKRLRIDSLVGRDSDGLDFYDVSVGSLKDALDDAYKAGSDNALEENGLMVLDHDERKKFVDALTRPPEPNSYLLQSEQMDMFAPEE